MTLPADDDPYAVAVAARDEALAEVARLSKLTCEFAAENERKAQALQLEVQRLEADLAVAVHEAVQARAKLAGHYYGGRDKA